MRKLGEHLDSVTMKKMFFLLATLLPVFTQGQDHTVYFNTDNFEITSEKVEALDGFVRNFDQRKEPLYRVNLIGFTDSIGDKTYNLDLSRKRAMAVKTYLESIGIKAKYIFTEYYGSEKAISSNKTEEGRAANRRVEVYFNSTSEAMLRDSTITDLFLRLAPKEQLFTIDNSSGAVIVGKQGTKLQFSPNSFVESNGKLISGPVEVTLREFYSPSAMIFGNLNTITTDGKQLVTAGMLEVRAKSRGKYININPEIPYTVSFNPKMVTDKMLLFYGKPDKRTQQITWQEALKENTPTVMLSSEGVEARQETREEKERREEYVRKMNSPEYKKEIAEMQAANEAKNKKEREEFEKIRKVNDSLRILNQKYNETLRAVTTSNLQKFSSQRLGYLNCDAYMTGKPINFGFNIDDFKGKKYVVSLILTEGFNGIFTLATSEGLVGINPSLDEGRKAIVSIVLIENNEIMTDIQPIEIKQENKIIFQPSLTSVKDFKAELESVKFN